MILGTSTQKSPITIVESLRGSMNVSEDNVRLEGVLNKWIETESVPVTWDRLIEGLEEIKLRIVIRECQGIPQD